EREVLHMNGLRLQPNVAKLQVKGMIVCFAPRNRFLFRLLRFLGPGLKLTMGQSNQRNGDQQTSKNSMHGRILLTKNFGSGIRHYAVKSRIAQLEKNLTAINKPFFHSRRDRKSVV